MTPASKGLTREEAYERVLSALGAPDGVIGVRGQRVAGSLTDLLLSIDRSARESEWEARGGPELVKAATVLVLQEEYRKEGPHEGRAVALRSALAAVGAQEFTPLAYAELIGMERLREALTRSESPATAPASEEGR